MTSNDDNIVEFFRWCHAEGKLPALIVILFLMTLCVIGIFAIAYGSSAHNLTLDCIRMFFSDEWNRGYVTDLAQYCQTKK